MKNPSEAKAENKTIVLARQYGLWPLLIGIPPGVFLFLFSPVIFLVPLFLGFCFLLLIKQSNVQPATLKIILVVSVQFCGFVLAIITSLVLCRLGLVNCADPRGILAIHGAWFGLILLYDVGMIIWSAIMRISR